VLLCGSTAIAIPMEREVDIYMWMSEGVSECERGVDRE
jgi:hypothetical protein